MKIWWVVVLCVLCSSPVWAQEKERLALTVHYDKGDPGEERDVWIADFFVDETGRIKRLRVVRESPFVGEPSTTTDRRFVWKGDTVVQGDFADGKSVGWEARLVREEQGEIRVSRRVEMGDSPYLSTIRFLDAKNNTWAEQNYVSHWSSESGYSRTVSSLDKKGESAPLIVQTAGSRLVTTLEDRLYSFVLLDRSPTALTGTFYDSFLEENGWVPVGQVRFSGVGLWNQDPLVRLVHGFVLSSLLIDPVWVPMVFEKSYLK